ncbi:MAG TPA: uroporphyrinogen-III synthase [Burkholderiales bacterium]
MSLAGRGVLVTRPAGMADALAERIERAGGRALRFPAIVIEPLGRPAAFDRLHEFALAVFVSPSAVACALAMTGPWPRGVRAAAVGEGTRRALERSGFAEVIAPRQGADSEALLAAPELAGFAGKRVLIVRGAGGRELLARALAERGCQVEIAECYRRAPPSRDAADLRAEWAQGKVHALTAFSAEALDNLLALFGEARLAAVPLFVPHERIAEHARRRGLQAIIAGPGDDAMVERLVAYFHERD